MYKNQLNNIQTCWTVGYVIGEIPSNIALTRVKPKYFIPAMEVGFSHFFFFFFKGFADLTLITIAHLDHLDILSIAMPHRHSTLRPKILHRYCIDLK